MIILRNYGLNQGHILATNFPELAEQWNYEKNGTLTPWDVTISSPRKVWWKCSLGHEWEAVINDRTTKSLGCPYCSGRRAWPGYNDLATLFPELAAEWDDERNGDLTPQMVRPGSGRKVWWKCSLGHEWETSVVSRTSASHGCPYCAGVTVWSGYNDLATLRPDIAADWDYELNDKLPSEVMPYSQKKAWWICRNGHPSYHMSVNCRSNGQKCPKCGREKVAAGQRKKVLCYSQDGQFLGAYPSVKVAARENGTVKSEVRAVCKGRRKADKGIVYRYADQQEKEPVQDEEKLRDVLNQEISVGDEVMFIKHTPHKATKTQRGTVTGITNHSLLIGTGDGESCRIIASRDDPVFVPKVLVMRPRPERPEEGAPDASGYPVREGDPVVYMPPLASNRCKGFLFGTVKKAAGKTWEVNGTRRTSDRIIVVNW